MKQIVSLFLFFLFCFSTPSCKNEIDLDDYPKSSMRSIIKFSILPDYNLGNILTEHKGVIDEKNKTITLHLHPKYDLTALRPEITLSPKTSIEPGNYHVNDFSSLNTSYCAIAENGKKSYYDVMCELDYKFSGATAIAVILPEIFDTGTNNPIRTLFNSGAATVYVPQETRSSMKFKFELESSTSSYCVFDKDTAAYHDLSSRSYISFVLTSEDGSSSNTYTVWVRNLN